MLHVHVPAHMHTYTYTYMHMHMCMRMHMHISIVKCHVISCHVCMSMCPVSHMCIYQKQSERSLSWASLDTMPREIE